MKGRAFIVRALIPALVATGVLAGTAGAAQARPKQCNITLNAMVAAANAAHRARMSGDIAGWQVMNDAYVEYWYSYNDMGC